MPNKSPFRLKLNNPDFQRNPQGVFSSLLQRGEVFQGRVPLMGRTWIATSWQACSDTLRQTDDFVRDPVNAGKRKLAIQRVLPRSLNRLANNMLTRDKEDHRRLRSLVDKAFQRQNIAALEMRIQEIVDRQLDHVATLSGNGQTPIDFVEHFARPVPLIVICELLGLPDSDRPKFMKWFEGFSNVSSLMGIFRVVPGLRRSMRYLERHFEEVRKQPRDGLVTAMVQAEEDGEKLSREELLSMTMLLLLAGHETTIHLISNALLTLLQLDEDRQRLMNDWSLSGSAIDEVLRYNSVIFVSKPRFVCRDMEFYGQTMKRGELILPLLGSSNYDPAVFERPMEFLIDREKNRHLVFGSGPHICLGMKLARSEAEIATRQILKRWPDLQAAFDLKQPDFGRRMGMRTLKTLNLHCR